MTSGSAPAPSVESFPQALQLGVPAIDGQHRSLIDVLDRLVTDDQAVPGSERFSDVVTRLGHDLGLHFEFEERALQRLDMPAAQVEAHVAAHGAILQQYVELNFELMRQDLVVRSDVIARVRSWVLEHIIQHDLLMRAYL